MPSKERYKDWLKQVTVQVDIDYLRAHQICPENIALYDKCGDLSRFLFAGEIQDDHAILNTIYINSDKFFEASKLKKPDFFDEKYFQDIYELYEYRVNFHLIESGSISLIKKRKLFFEGYKISPSRSIYGRRTAIKIYRNNPMLARFAFLSGGPYDGSLNYQYLLKEYYNEDIDSLPALAAGITGFNLYSKASVDFIKGKHKQILLLPLLSIPLFYCAQIEIFFVILFLFLTIALIIYCFLNVRIEKIDKHLDLAFKHEALIEEGLERILQGKFVKTSSG